MLQKVKLGQTGLDVNRICLGGGSYGGTVKEPACVEQLDYFYSKGGIFLDTAVAYDDWYEGERSTSENYIGRWMQKNKRRHEMTLSVKGCYPSVLVPTNDLNTARYSGSRLHAEDIITDIEKSLAYLRTDYLDIFSLHKDDENVEVAEILGTLQQQKNRGVIRAYGCSNWRVERQREAYDHAQAHGLDGFMGDQISWCLNVLSKNSKAAKADPFMDNETYRFHNETKIPVMAYGANGRGYFHRLANGMEVREQDHVEYDCAQNGAILNVLKEAAWETGAEVNTIVIHYLLLDHGFQTIPIVGIKSLQEMDICLAALDYELPKEYENKLRELRNLSA